MGADLVSLLEPNHVSPIARLERHRPVRRGRAGAELARLHDRLERQLSAGDPGRKAEVVLDPARLARLPTQRAALHDQCVQPLGRAVDRSREPCGAGTDHEQVDLLARCQLAADPQCPRQLRGGGRLHLDPAR